MKAAEGASGNRLRLSQCGRARARSRCRRQARKLTCAPSSGLSAPSCGWCVAGAGRATASDPVASAADGGHRVDGPPLSVVTRLTSDPVQPGKTPRSASLACRQRSTDDEWSRRLSHENTASKALAAREPVPKSMASVQPGYTRARRQAKGDDSKRRSPPRYAASRARADSAVETRRR